MLSGTYKFTKYKEKLISKGRGKEPRVISIPTIRDKIVLRGLCDILLDLFSKEVDFKIVQTIISGIKYVIDAGEYDYFLKYDIKNFYPTIKHDILFRKLRRRIRNKPLLTLIAKALARETVCVINPGKSPANCEGVPQGLSISNILASIYLIDADKAISTKDFKYFRYVDDVLVICSESDKEKIDLSIIKIFKNLGLDIHEDSVPGKTSSGKLTTSFSYLGYEYNYPYFTVRKSSISNLRDSLIKIFTQYKYSENKNIKLFEWNLNLRITGCIFNDKKYGWLFFFSQIDRLQLLYEIDHFVLKMFDRFKIDVNDINLKRFVRVYSEIINNIKNTKYIPNFSLLSISEKRDILDNIFNIKLTVLDAVEIETRFDKLIYRSIRDIEKDFQNFS